MIEEPKTLTIQRSKRRPTQAQIDAFRSIPTGFVVDALFGGAAMSPDIKPLSPRLQSHVAGPALTVDNRPSDILALLAALKFITPGDIVLSTVKGFQGCAAAGDRLSGMMKNAGAAGFVTDGPMRDLAGIVQVGLPVWCTGLNPDSPFSTGPGKVGTPIVLGGQPVETGDMVIADEDGVVVVPFGKIDEVIARLASVAELEAALDASVTEGLAIPEDIERLVDSEAVSWI